MIDVERVQSLHAIDYLRMHLAHIECVRGTAGRQALSICLGEIRCYVTSIDVLIRSDGFIEI